MLDLETIARKFIAFPWPEYQEYMGEDWFRDECYYCADKDIYFVPEERVKESDERVKTFNN